MSRRNPTLARHPALRVVIVLFVLTLVAIRSLSGPVFVESTIERLERASSHCLPLDPECTAAGTAVDLGDDPCCELNLGSHLLAHDVRFAGLEQHVPSAVVFVFRSLKRVVALELFPLEIFHPPRD